MIRFIPAADRDERAAPKAKIAAMSAGLIVAVVAGWWLLSPRHFEPPLDESLPPAGGAEGVAGAHAQRAAARSRVESPRAETRDTGAGSPEPRPTEVTVASGRSGARRSAGPPTGRASQPERGLASTAPVAPVAPPASRPEESSSPERRVASTCAGRRRRRYCRRRRRLRLVAQPAPRPATETTSPETGAADATSREVPAERAEAPQIAATPPVATPASPAPAPAPPVPATVPGPRCRTVPVAAIPAPSLVPRLPRRRRSRIERRLRRRARPTAACPSTRRCRVRRARGAAPRIAEQRLRHGPPPAAACRRPGGAGVRGCVALRHGSRSRRLRHPHRPRRRVPSSRRCRRRAGLRGLPRRPAAPAPGARRPSPRPPRRVPAR